MSEIEHSRAYRTLDGLRGVAALIVVTRHVDSFFPWGLFPESFLAVDLFFLLSGFVVAYAYEARLLAGRSLASFMKTRLIRLYPLYVLGLAMGLLVKVVAAAGGGDWAPIGWSQAVVIGLLMLPAAPPLPMGGSTLDGPTWTLAPELVINLIYAAAVRRLSLRVLWTIVAVSGVGLIASEYAFGSLDEGWSAKAFPLLASRLGFSFFLGVILFRLRPQRRRGPVAAWGCLAALALILTLRPPEGLRHLYELAVVALAFPAIMMAAVRREPGQAGARAFAFLGAISYAVYVLHQPLGKLAGQAMERLGLGYPPPWPAAGAFLLGVAVIAALADWAYDAPLRRRLSGLRTARRGKLIPALSPGDA